MTKLLSNCKIVKHLEGQDYKVLNFKPFNSLFCVYELTAEKQLLPKWNNLYFKYIDTFNNLYYMVTTLQNSVALVDKVTGTVVFDEKQPSYDLIPFTDNYILKTNYTINGMPSSKEVYKVSNFKKLDLPLARDISLISEKIIQVCSMHDNLTHFYDLNFKEIPFLSQYYPCNIYDLNKSYYLIESHKFNNYLVDKNTGECKYTYNYGLVKNITNNFIDFFSDKTYMHFLINRTNLEKSADCYMYKILNEQYLFLATEPSKKYGIILKCDDFETIAKNIRFYDINVNNNHVIFTDSNNVCYII